MRRAIKNLLKHLAVSLILFSVGGICFITSLGHEVTEPYTVVAKYGEPEAKDNEIHTNYILILENSCDRIVDLKVTPATHYMAKKGDVLHFTTTEGEYRNPIHCHEFPWYVGPEVGIPSLFLMTGGGIYLIIILIGLLTEIFD